MSGGGGGYLFFDLSLEAVEEDRVGVDRLVEVLGELGLDLLADGELLGLDEGLEHDSDREVDVVAADVVAEGHSGRRLRHPQNRLDVPDSDVETANNKNDEEFLTLTSAALPSAWCRSY